MNINNDNFLFANPKPCPNGFKNVGGKCTPSTSIVQNGLQFLTSHPKISKDKIPKVYQPLVQQGYLTNKNGKWTSNPSPSGQPPIVIPQQQPKPPKPPKPSNNGGGGQVQNPPSGSQGVKSTYPSAPQQQKPTTCQFGGQNVKKCLLQYYNGDQNFIVSNNGTRLQARINQSSYDGSKSDKSQNRLRNEIALQNILQKDGQNVSFDFSASGTQNIDKTKSAIFFQIKPTGGGGNDALIRLGVRDGKIAYGIGGGNMIPINIPAGQRNNIQFKMNSGRAYLYINGKQVNNSSGSPISVSLGNPNDSQLKFGLEGVPEQINGDIVGSYDNIQIS